MLFILALVAVALALIFTNIVLREAGEFTLKLSIDSEKGESVFESIGSVNVGGQGSLRLRVEVVSVEGLNRIVLNGKAILESTETKYEIFMPCIYSLNTSCYRVMMVIPGWDQPLRIQPGEYSLTIELAWSNAGGKGAVTVKVKPEITYEGSK